MLHVITSSSVGDVTQLLGGGVEWADGSYESMALATSFMYLWEVSAKCLYELRLTISSAKQLVLEAIDGK